MARVISNIVSWYLGLGIAMILAVTGIAAVIISWRKGTKFWNNVCMVTNYMGVFPMITATLLWPWFVYTFIRDCGKDDEDMDILEIYRKLDEFIEEIEKG